MPPPAVPQPPLTAHGTITTTPTTGTEQHPVPAIRAALPWFPLPASPAIVHYLWWTRLPPQAPTTTGALPSPTTLLPGRACPPISLMTGLPSPSACACPVRRVTCRVPPTGSTRTVEQRAWSTCVVTADASASPWAWPARTADTRRTECSSVMIITPSSSP